MFCTNCGATLPDGSKFCNNCGAKVLPIQPPIPPEPAVDAAPPAETPEIKPIPALSPLVDAALDAEQPETAVNPEPEAEPEPVIPEPPAEPELPQKPAEPEPELPQAPAEPEPELPQAPAEPEPELPPEPAAPEAFIRQPAQPTYTPPAEPQYAPPAEPKYAPPQYSNGYRPAEPAYRAAQPTNYDQPAVQEPAQPYAQHPQHGMPPYGQPAQNAAPYYQHPAQPNYYAQPSYPQNFGGNPPQQPVPAPKKRGVSTGARVLALLAALLLIGSIAMLFLNSIQITASFDAENNDIATTLYGTPHDAFSHEESRDFSVMELKDLKVDYQLYFLIGTAAALGLGALFLLLGALGAIKNRAPFVLGLIFGILGLAAFGANLYLITRDCSGNWMMYWSAISNNSGAWAQKFDSLYKAGFSIPQPYTAVMPSMFGWILFGAGGLGCFLSLIAAIIGKKKG